MIWEQQCPAVINLTRCIEKGREKCDQYWPLDVDPVTYGEIEVGAFWGKQRLSYFDGKSLSTAVGSV